MLYFTGLYDKIALGGPTAMLIVLLQVVLQLVVFFAINSKLLFTKGQTIAKQMLNIKIVTHSDSLPSKEQFFKRYGIMYGLQVFPFFVGNILALVNACLIFRENHQCGHDEVAKTKVVTTQ